MQNSKFGHLNHADMALLSAKVFIQQIFALLETHMVLLTVNLYCLINMPRYTTLKSFKNIFACFAP